jgi:fibro-slime domain-containing protein
MLKLGFAVALAVVSVGCTSDPGRLGEGGGGGSGGGGGVNIKLDGGKGGSGGDAGPSTPGQLTLVVRDFRLYNSGDSKTNPDFENVPKTDKDGNSCNPECYGPWPDLEIVTDTLGDDYKPVYKNASGTTLSTHGKASFDQWYRTVEGTNIMQEIPIGLTKNSKGLLEYDSRRAGAPLSPGGMFFPIDDGSQQKTAFGNEGKSHNYSFTVEIHTLFTYGGGETFSFSGDDDVFVYINKKLVINLGGIHGREEQSVNIDSLGLEKEKTYQLDFFYAERHVVESNLWITTTLDLTNNRDIPIF